MENPREIIDDKYQAFIDNDSIHMNYTKLEYVYKSYIGLLDKVDAVSMLMNADERAAISDRVTFNGAAFSVDRA